MLAFSLASAMLTPMCNLGHLPQQSYRHDPRLYVKVQDVKMSTV